MYKKILGIIIFNLLILSIASHAENKSQFKIEGMSLNESLLKYFSKQKIIENEIPIYDDKNFLASLFPVFSLFYDDIAIDYKPNDPKYIIQGITGFMGFKDDIDGCYAKQNEIDNIIQQLVRYNHNSYGVGTISQAAFTNCIKMMNKYMEFYPKNNLEPIRDMSEKVKMRYEYQDDVRRSYSHTTY